MYIILIAISLSMDAFSLALAYGTLGNKAINIKLSFIVGLFHFIMPLLGMKLGYIFNLQSKFIVFIILLFLGIQMIIETFKNENLKNIVNLKDMLLFGLAVSLDSFSVGISLSLLTNKLLISALLFAFISFVFTYLGLLLGNGINSLIGKTSTIIGGIVLIILSFSYII